MSQPTSLPSAARAFLGDSRESAANLLHFLQEAGCDSFAERVQWVLDNAELWAAAGDGDDENDDNGDDSSGKGAGTAA